MMVFAPIWFHINDFELLRAVPGTEFRRASFPCSKKPPILRISLFFLGPGSLGPRPMVPLGPMGPPFSRFVDPIFRDFLTFCKMVRDLSRSVPMVFRSPGKVLIKLFHFIFNSKCHFLKVKFFI